MKIFVDWGSTNFRAFLMDGDRVAGRCQSADNGVLKHFRGVTDEMRIARFSAFLKQMIGGWLTDHPDCPVTMCGAVGSREGWIDTGYTEAPADIARIAGGLRRLTREQAGDLKNHALYIVPGLAVHDARQGRHDVLRSEDIKSFGALACAGRRDALLCIPGTHCKWVEVRAGTVTGFQTLMTGELYALLGEAGSLSVLFEQGDQDNYDAFDAGFDLAVQENDLLVDLFQLRSRILRGVAPVSPRSFLSGILIGHELRQARRSYETAENIILLSDPGPRQSFYQHALERSGWAIDAVIGSEQAVCAGLSLLQEAMN